MSSEKTIKTFLPQKVIRLYFTSNSEAFSSNSEANECNADDSFLQDFQNLASSLLIRDWIVNKWIGICHKSPPSLMA